VGEPLAGPKTRAACSAPHALRGRDRVWCVFTAWTKAHPRRRRRYPTRTDYAGPRWRYAGRKIHGAARVTGVPISALWNPKMLTPALTYINCLAKP